MLYTCLLFYTLIKFPHDDADIRLWTVESAFGIIGFLTWATPLQYPILVPYLHFIWSCLLFPHWASGRVQLVDVLRAEFLHVSFSKWRTSVGSCYHLARCFLEHLNFGVHTCKYLMHYANFSCRTYSRAFFIIKLLVVSLSIHLWFLHILMSRLIWCIRIQYHVLV